MFSKSKAEPKPEQHYEFTLTDEEWRKRLTPEQYAVLRQHGTEPAGSSPLENEHRQGTYSGAGCELPL
ncbi:MAG TPA: peptide-methionine (R)-S-oxide reductase, partial [Candidatus Eremiobacteraceae bacterium]|nr:peptide-methionine (R)-S-oxide reductase [Candidatus Eremiobacteraceae bacterium]